MLNEKIIKFFINKLAIKNVIKIITKTNIILSEIINNFIEYFFINFSLISSNNFLFKNVE